MSDYGTEAEAVSDWFDECDDFNCSAVTAKPKTKNQKANKPKTASKSLKKELSGISSYYVNMKCHCGNNYQARRVDLMRMWGLSCSKRCASIRREYGRPRASVLNGSQNQGQAK